jgi:hypothetical protein
MNLSEIIINADHIVYNENTHSNRERLPEAYSKTHKPDLQGIHNTAKGQRK